MSEPVRCGVGRAHFFAGQCPWAVSGRVWQILRAAVAVGAVYTLFSLHGNSIVPAGLENSSVRYFSVSNPFACAVEMTEYSAALDFAPFAVFENYRVNKRAT